MIFIILSVIFLISSFIILSIAYEEKKILNINNSNLNVELIKYNTSLVAIGWTFFAFGCLSGLKVLYDLYQYYRIKSEFASDSEHEDVVTSFKKGHSAFLAEKVLNAGTEDELDRYCNQLFKNSDDEVLYKQYNDMKEVRSPYEVANLCKSYSKTVLNQK